MPRVATGFEPKLFPFALFDILDPSAIKTAGDLSGLMSVLPLPEKPNAPDIGAQTAKNVLVSFIRTIPLVPGCTGSALAGSRTRGSLPFTASGESHPALKQILY